MAYVKTMQVATLYQGTSYTQSLVKSDGSTWAPDERLNYKMTDETNVIVSQGDLIRSGDDLSYTFTIPASDTISLLGDYLLLVYQTDITNANVNVPVAQYDITYITTGAT